MRVEELSSSAAEGPSTAGTVIVFSQSANFHQLFSARNMFVHSSPCLPVLQQNRCVVSCMTECMTTITSHIGFPSESHVGTDSLRSLCHSGDDRWLHLNWIE